MHAADRRGWACASPSPLSSPGQDRKSTRLNSSHLVISYAVFCLKKKITFTLPFVWGGCVQRKVSVAIAQARHLTSHLHLDLIVVTVKFSFIRIITQRVIADGVR